MITFKCGEIIRLPMKRKQDRVYLASDMAYKTRPRDMGNGYNFSTITGILRVKDKVHSVGPCKVSSGFRNTFCQRKQLPPSQEENLQDVKYEYGSLDMEALIKMLTHDEFAEKVSVERTGSTIILNMVSEKIQIKINDNDTQLFYSGKQSTRLKLRDLLLKCINNF